MFLSFGAWVYRYRWPMVAVWAVFIVAALPLAPRVFGVLAAGGFASEDMEEVRASRLLTERFQYDPATLAVVYEDPTGARRASDPSFLAEIDASLAAVRRLPEVASVTTPSMDPRLIAPDGAAAYATIALKTVPEDFRTVLPSVQGALGPTSLRVTLSGAPVFYQDIQEVTERDLRRAEIISFPFAALALCLVFGSLVAAAVPGLIGGAAVVLALAGMVLLSRVTDLSIFSLNLTTMLGLGLGIDYCLFVVSRFREELGRGMDVPEATARAVATAGQAVLYSGVTVFVGLLALLLFDVNALRSLGIAGSLVVAICVVAALTLLPAVLGILGQRIDALGIPGLLQRRHDPAANERRGFWAKLAQTVMAHPVATLIPVLVVLVGLGVPFTRVVFGAPDASILPPDVQSRRGFDVLSEHWGAGELSPVLVVLQTADGGPPLRSDAIGPLYDFIHAIAADERVERVRSVMTLDPRITRGQYGLIYQQPDPDQISDAYAQAMTQATVSGDTLVVQVTSRYGQTDERSKALVRDIRATPPPPGFKLLVGGGTAGVIDYVDRLYADFPRAAAFVIATVYLVLLLTFRSVLLPLKAIAMNTLSILASYGALVVIFQEGALSAQLGFQPLGFVEASLPIVMFCVLFGLSMDYEVFLLSRVKESFDAGADNRASVAAGIERSGRIITSAAGIVILVSLSFVAADIVLIKALGLGTAIAVFLDATVVRALLVPATMRLLGDWNWWAPAWLDRRLPRIGSHAD